MSSPEEIVTMNTSAVSLHPRPIAPTFRRLKPVLRRFVDGHLAGQKGVEIVRRLRPEVKRPEVLASKWLMRADVKAAIAERLDAPAAIMQTLANIERRLGAIEQLLQQVQGNGLTRPLTSSNIRLKTA